MFFLVKNNLQKKLSHKRQLFTEWTVIIQIGLIQLDLGIDLGLVA